jgi:hypothetical protein
MFVCTDKTPLLLPQLADYKSEVNRDVLKLFILLAQSLFLWLTVPVSFAALQFKLKFACRLAA